ncbi:hypothetical protein D3C87_1956550 [compost metagenome]
MGQGLIAGILFQSLVDQQLLGRNREHEPIRIGHIQHCRGAAGTYEIEPAVRFQCEFDTALVFNGEQ